MGKKNKNKIKNPNNISAKSSIIDPIQKEIEEIEAVAKEQEKYLLIGGYKEPLPDVYFPPYRASSIKKGGEGTLRPDLKME